MVPAGTEASIGLYLNLVKIHAVIRIWALGLAHGQKYRDKICFIWGFDSELAHDQKYQETTIFIRAWALGLADGQNDEVMKGFIRVSDRELAHGQKVSRSDGFHQGLGSRASSRSKSIKARQVSYGVLTVS